MNKFKKKEKKLQKPVKSGKLEYFSEGMKQKTRIIEAAPSAVSIRFSKKAKKRYAMNDIEGAKRYPLDKEMIDKI